ncbi:DNA-processing protein DprA [Alloscardovia theropitheci]|uniref:DNA-processing protein DprA n=1 Tax=Alloscardovia theropitheci TaxID=2496842 RepID=A0A4R0QN24_9BIFI|nr:DNA-processing protein DprA [Alloscardovia theropitheci]TCD53544.1 DNA-processing protein DprA [Alloscardovia theropitheci]
MQPPTDTAIAHAALTFAASGADEIMFFLSARYKQGNAISLWSRLQELSIEYKMTHSLPDYSDLNECVMSTAYSRTLSKRLHKVLPHWLAAIESYAHMSLVSLASMLTRNYKYWIIDETSPFWPRQLYDLVLHTDSSAPLCLWGLGDPSALVSCSQPVSIVGSRSVNNYGRSVAFSAGKYAALHGHLVVSGGALGADAAAHWGALGAFDVMDNPGRTVAVMAGGLDYTGPAQNAGLFERIQNSHGAIISELAPCVVPEPYRFLQRNRLIAALGSTVIIAQAQHRSGALNTATWAANLDRFILAAPGNINTPYNTGCNRLIYDHKATLLASAHDMSDVCHAAHEPFAQNQTFSPAMLPTDTESYQQ